MLAGCGGGRAPEAPEPAPDAQAGPVAVQPVATPVGAMATALAATPEPGTTFDSPLGTTLDSPIATPSPDRAALEEAIAAAMFEMIVAQELGATPVDAGEADASQISPEDALIVWANALPPAPESEGQTAFDRLPKLDESAPIRVWVSNAGGQAVVSGDAAARAEAIRAYRAATIEQDSAADIQKWGLYAFGIVALDEAAGQATVYRDASCGRLCGSGMLYTLTRGPDGAWSVSDAANLWIS